MSLEVQRPSGVTVFEELTFDELTFDNKIHRGNVKRSTHRLLTGLDNLGVHLTQPAEVTIKDVPPPKMGANWGLGANWRIGDRIGDGPQICDYSSLNNA